VLKGLDVAQHRQSEEREEDGKGRESDKRNIECAMELQAGAAAAALDEMLFVIPAHLGIDPGDVIPPACKDCAYNPVGTWSFRHNRWTHLLENVPVCQGPRNGSSKLRCFEYALDALRSSIDAKKPNRLKSRDLNPNSLG
jgi:hypothetical protein